MLANNETGAIQPVEAIARIAAEADVYPRFAQTMEWDTAAGDAVLRAAGGIVLGADGAPLEYGKIGVGLRNGGFVAWSDARLAARHSRT